MTPTTVSWPAATARRMSRQWLTTPAPAGTGPAEVAARMLGAHAQVASAAEVSLALRTEGATRANVRHAVTGDHTLVRTFGPRGTVHLLPAADLSWWTGALSALPAGPGPFAPDVRMTPAQTEEVLAAIADALTGTELTVDELTEAVVRRAGPWAGDPVMPAFQTLWPRWRQVTHTAAHRGVLAFGADRGRKVTYTNPGCVPQDADESLARLVDRYLHAYGPVGAQDFALWLAAPRAWAAELFASLAAGGRIEEVSFPVGRAGPAYVVPGDTAFPDEPARGVRLLPYFDGYVIATRPRELLFPGPAAGRALAGGQAGNYPVLLIDGTVAGVWHQRRAGRRIVITVEPLAPLAAAHHRALEHEAERTAVILEGVADLTVGTVTVGPHA
ncbi:winged helix DNA-binding domain-containing protein [Streptomyces sp. NBC_00249]|uniref:winged helix DNA-binding domain-containing protein n=1 Tax=Streptomyces sp. NBC_00249 TaxID=2975690 RepID=UPI0022580C70|nr:winged helix DNA-binding domain-containing protein [Streptomyces sp. NBC_00249]MCX5192406.1 winged helix DNA-binding domain-containing protein [Streptomyces sp. NBC_00249]